MKPDDIFAGAWERVKCKNCDVLKPTTEFYIDGRSGKIRNPCKDCLNARHRALASTDKAKAAKKAYRKANQERQNEHNRKYRQVHGDRVAAYREIWNNDNPEKRKAHRKVWNALKTGAMKKNPCEVCGSAYVHAHHPDYEKPLEVLWLCPEHHADVHR